MAGPVANYPAPRARALEAPPQVSEKYERYETLGPFGTTDTMTFVGEFSGRPDAIDVTAFSASALIRLADKVGRESSDIAINVGGPHFLHISRERVSVQSRIPGSAAAVTITGKWAAPREAS